MQPQPPLDGFEGLAPSLDPDTPELPPGLVEPEEASLGLEFVTSGSSAPLGFELLAPGDNPVPGEE